MWKTTTRNKREILKLVLAEPPVATENYEQSLLKSLFEDIHAAWRTFFSNFHMLRSKSCSLFLSVSGLLV
jgi:hypothetical protein